MAKAKLSYNERSWAIDVINEINNYTKSRNRAIKRAGGEYTLDNGAKKLFPDIILFGLSILQGWELKMPDTGVTDIELLKNAEAKARKLNLDSFLVFNANEAVLYSKDTADRFVVTKQWGPAGLYKREEVESKSELWKNLLIQILDFLNDKFDGYRIQLSAPEVIFSDGLLSEYIQLYTPILARSIQQSRSQSLQFNAEIIHWQEQNQMGEDTKDEEVARISLIGWLNRLLFAHYLKRFNTNARAVETIKIHTEGNTTRETTVEEAKTIFTNISASSDFMHIFRNFTSLDYVDPVTWSGLIYLNGLLTDCQIEEISQSSFHKVIDTVLVYSKKKVAGQFATPPALAELLTYLTIENLNKPVLDPCAGTGTIPRAISKAKLANGVSPADTLAQTWASDKYPFLLQLCSIALSNPVAMGEVVQVFKQDAFTLATNQAIEFTDPNTGKTISRALPKMHAIISNLPFVCFEDMEKANQIPPSLKIYMAEHDLKLSGKSDLYAYLIATLQELVENKGRLGFILSNSWLAADWGKQFKQLLFKNFHIRQVIISGNGRWFQNAKVVATLLVLEKKHQDSAEEVTFITTTKPLEQWDPTALANHIRAKSSTNDYTTQTYSHAHMEELTRLGLNWNAFFVDTAGISAVSELLVPVSTLFKFNRGERRGWNDLFLPEKGHSIDSDYIKPIAKSSSELVSLITQPKGEAFCCSKTIADLQQLGHVGTLSWIKKFADAVNGKGLPLQKVLAHKNTHWYEMKAKASTQAQLCVSNNPGKCLCVYKFTEPSFIDQRLIGLTLDAEVNLDLAHALLNSVVTMFFLEGSGFGRGEGVLDLNAKNLKARLQVLNPKLLSPEQQASILGAFAPLLQRKPLPLDQELLREDRIAFDREVLKCYGREDLQPIIYKAMLQLFTIRQAVHS